MALRTANDPAGQRLARTWCTGPVSSSASLTEGLAAGAATRDRGQRRMGRHRDILTFSCTDGQQAGSGFLSDSQISSALVLILPRRNLVGTGHRCNTLDAITGDECHAALPLGHVLSAGTTCGHLTKCSKERCGREETETRLSCGSLWLCNTRLTADLAMSSSLVAQDTGFSCLCSPENKKKDSYQKKASMLKGKTWNSGVCLSPLGYLKCS